MDLGFVCLHRSCSLEVTGSAFRSRTQTVSSRLDDYLPMETIGKGRCAANDADSEKQ